MYKGSSIRLTMDFLLETMEARMQRDDIVKELKGKYCQPKSLYLTKLFFRNERKIKTFPYKQKLNFYHLRHHIQEIIKGILQSKMKVLGSDSKPHK